MEKNVLGNVCRACMTQDGIFQSVFLPVENNGSNIELAEMVMTYASVQIIVGDGLPEQICTNCVKKVSEFYLFKLKCEESDRKFRSKLSKSLCGAIKEETEFNSCFEAEYDPVDVKIKQEFCAEDKANLLNIEQLDNFKDSVVGQCFKIEPNCDDGGFQRINEENNKIELPDVKPELNFHCSLCRFTCITEECYTKHLAVHQKSYDCEAYNSSSLVIQDCVESCNCNLCSKHFKTTEKLSQHKNVHSRINLHVCTVCSKGFNQISILNDHMKVHTAEKPFMCSTCGKYFSQLRNLKRHSIRHTGIKTHLSNICDSGFNSEGKFTTHLTKHTGTHPFVCSECNKTFTSSSSLSKHKRIHSGEKPYECEVCNMKFTQSGILTRHRQTHMADKTKNVCNFCFEVFSGQNDLSSHLPTHTGKKPYMCNVCGQTFKQSSTLKKHKKFSSCHRDLLQEQPEEVIRNISKAPIATI